MSKNIVILFDGTCCDNTSRKSNDLKSNVAKLYNELLYSNQLNQSVYYDAGVGTDLTIVAGAISGYGLSENLRQAYAYLVENYNVGDHIFVFGFSRGAFTARSFVGFIRSAGILKKPDGSHDLNSYDHIITQAYKIYHDEDHKPDGEVAVRFRESHSHPLVKIRFLGVWDTVGSLGLPDDLIDDSNFSHIHFHDLELTRYVEIARHALSIDDHRKDFKPTLWIPNGVTDSEQRWFSGSHGDVGGGNPPLSDHAGLWIINHAIKAGLHLPHIRPETFHPNPLDVIHLSVLETVTLGLRAYNRPIGYAGDETIDESVIERFHKFTDYRPKNPANPKRFENQLPQGLFTVGPAEEPKGFVLPHNYLVKPIGSTLGAIPVARHVLGGLFN